MRHRLVVAVLLLAMLGVASGQSNEEGEIFHNNWKFTRILQTGDIVDGLIYFYTGHGQADHGWFAGWGQFYDPKTDTGFLEGAYFRINLETGEASIIARESSGYSPDGSLAPSNGKNISPSGDVLICLQKPGFKCIVARVDNTFENVVSVGQQGEFGRVDYVSTLSFLPDDSVLIMAEVTVGIVNNIPYSEEMLLRWAKGRLTKVWGRPVVFSPGGFYLYNLPSAPELEKPFVQIANLAFVDGSNYRRPARLAFLDDSGKVNFLTKAEFTFLGRKYRPVGDGLRQIVANGDTAVFRAQVFDGVKNDLNDLLWVKKNGDMGQYLDGSLLGETTPIPSGAPPMYMSTEKHILFGTVELDPINSPTWLSIRNTWYVPGSGEPPELVAGVGSVEDCVLCQPEDDSNGFWPLGTTKVGSQASVVLIHLYTNESTSYGGDLYLVTRLNPVITKVTPEPEVATPGGKVMLDGKRLCPAGEFTKVWVGGQEVPFFCRNSDGTQLEITALPFFVGQVSVTVGVRNSNNGEMMKSNTIFITIKPAMGRYSRARVGSIEVIKRRQNLNQGP